MKKTLLLAAFAFACSLGSYAYDANEYVYSSTARYKTLGENQVKNGSFEAGNTEGWCGAENGTTVNASAWSYTAGIGPNGEDALVSLGTTVEGDMALSRNITGLKGGNYVVSYWIKGTTSAATSVTAGATNYANIYVNHTDGTTSHTAEVASFSAEWSQVVDTVNIADESDILVVMFNKFETDAAITGLSVNEATEVYDNRILQRKMAYIDALVATGKFVNDTDNGFLGIVEMVRGMLEDESSLDDKAAIEDMLGSFDEELTAWLNVNSADILKGKKRWESYGDTRKQDAIGEGWSGTGGRWFHKNNGGGDGDEIGHRLQGGMAPGAATQYYTINPLITAGTYMFSVETFGHYMVGTSSSSGNYTTDYARPFRGATYYIGLDHLGSDAAANEALIENGTVKAVDGGVLNNHYYKTMLVFFEVTEEMLGKPLYMGVTYIPDPNGPAKNGSNLQLRNPQIRCIGIDNDTYELGNELSSIKTQQGVLAERIVEAQGYAAKTKADNAPWGRPALNEAITAAQEVLDWSYSYINVNGEIVNIEGVKELYFDPEQKSVSDSVLVQVNAIKRAWQTWEAKNKHFTDLIATCEDAEAFLAENEGRGDATLRAQLETLVQEARQMIADAEDGIDGEEEGLTASFDEKNLAVKEAKTAYFNTTASYDNPAPQVFSANPETYNDKAWTFSEATSGKEQFKKSTQGAGWEAGYYTAVWRGNSAYPTSKMTQTKTITAPGVYKFRAHAIALNEDFGRHTGMATITVADPEAGVVADTVYNKCGVKLLFGLNGQADSVTVISRYRLSGGGKNDGAGSALARLGYDACEYAIYYLKEGEEPVEVEFGMDSYQQANNPDGGANNYGFGDTKFEFLGGEAAFRTAFLADMTARIQAQKDLLAAAKANEVTNEAAATWIDRLERRMVDADAAAAKTATMEDLTDLQNAVFFIEEMGSKITAIENAIETGIDRVANEPVAKEAAKGAYTLSGVRVNPSNLTKGLYIINGKKYVVK